MRLATPVMRRRLHRLPDGPFRRLRVPEQDPHARRALVQPHRERHPEPDRRPLAERAGRGLDPGQLGDGRRVALDRRAEPPERQQHPVVDGADRLQRRVQHGRGVSFREHEPIVGRALRVGRGRSGGGRRTARPPDARPRARTWGGRTLPRWSIGCCRRRAVRRVRSRGACDRPSRPSLPWSAAASETTGRRPWAPFPAVGSSQEHASMTTFRDLGVSDEVVRALAARGIEAPFPIQVMVIEDATSGRDTLARSKTGSGKTLGFAIPIVDQVDPARRPSTRRARAHADARTRPTGERRVRRHRRRRRACG